jgi:hypothetical protein
MAQRGVLRFCASHGTELLNSGAACRRQRRLWPIRPDYADIGDPLVSTESAAETPKPRRKPPLAEQWPLKADIAVKQREERVRTIISGSPARPDEPVSGELIPPLYIEAKRRYKRRQKRRPSANRARGRTKRVSHCLPSESRDFWRPRMR